MVGAAVVRRLGATACQVVTAGREEVDLTRQSDVERWVEKQRPDAVVMCAARVGGIHANSTLPAEFLFLNLMIGANVVNAAFRAGVRRLVNIGSSCMYPAAVSQPMAESSLMTGPPEPTNAAYAMAKLATAGLAGTYRKQYGVDYVTAIPTNLYGPGDNFDPMMSHVAPALMRRMIEARDNGAPKVEIWGSGKPRRELMFVDDAADAIVFVLERYSAERADQYRNRLGRVDPRARRDHRANRRLPRRTALRCEQARWRPAQIARQLATDGARLEGVYQPCGRPGPDVSLVRQSQGRCRLATRWKSVRIILPPVFIGRCT